MAKWKQMTEKERYYIERCKKKNMSAEEIAKDLNRNPSTIYRELKRGKCKQLNSDLTEREVYLADVGQRMHDENAHHKGTKKKLSQDDSFLQVVKYWILEKKYSPQAVCFKLKNCKCCHSTIYNYIRSGYLLGVTIENLPYAKRKKKNTTKKTKRPYGTGRSIEDRPKYINDRSVYGHWEMDTVYSSHDDLHCLLVLTERKFREEIVIRMKDRTAPSVVRALDRLERTMGTPAFRNKFKSITCDNGMEFAHWKDIERSCRTKQPRTTVYFCHPYTSCERGSNENENRMIRRWIPKGDDIGLYSPAEVKEIQEWINDYPRGIFGGMSSREYAMASM